MKTFVTALTLALAVSTLHAGDTWPQWRGPARDGQFTGAAWPADLKSEHLKLAWRVELGPGYSSPVVTPDRVFTTETKDKQTEIVRALDRATGQELWRQEWDGALSVPFFARANGDWIRATPAWDGTNLFVAGMRDVLVALDAQTGGVKWRKDLVAELKSPLPAFGFVSSPLVDGDALFVQAGGGVLRLDKQTGDVKWRALPSDDKMMGSAFASPILATLGGQRQLVVQTRTELAGLDPATGGVLWRQPVEAFRGMNILTPTIQGDRVFTSTYGGRTQAFDVSAAGDGKLAVTPAWNFKAQGYMTSPVIVNGHAYLHLRNQRALCVDLATGAEKWTTGESFGNYWSLVANGDRILALDQRGELLLLRANPEKFDLVDRRKVSGAETWAHLAVAGDQLFIRGLDALSAWDWRATAAAK